MRRPRRSATAALTLVAALALAGCSGDDTEPGGGATEAASASPSVSPSASVAASDPSSGAAEPTSDPTTSSSAEPGVTPASGPALVTEAATMRVPRGWSSPDEGPLSVMSNNPKISSIALLGSIPAADAATLESLENAAKVTSYKPEQVRVQPRREVQGVELYHLVGPEVVGGRLDQFGTLHAGQQVTIAFNTPHEMSQKRREALIDAMLASLEWA